jgi:hypothetical protein
MTTSKTGRSTDINLIEEVKGVDMFPTGDSKQIYGDPSTSERKQATQKLGKSARNGLEQQENENGKSTDVNLIEEGKGVGVVPTGDSKQVYGDPSISEYTLCEEKFLSVDEVGKKMWMFEKLSKNYH